MLPLVALVGIGVALYLSSQKKTTPSAPSTAPTPPPTPAPTPSPATTAKALGYADGSAVAMNEYAAGAKYANPFPVEPNADKAKASGDPSAYLQGYNQGYNETWAKLAVTVTAGWRKR